MSSAAKPTNAHYSVDPEGRTVVDYSFVSEALGMPATMGYGWARFEFGDQIGKDQRYAIKRKLGWGSHSSTWLARDKRKVNEDENAFVAIKALTGHMTDMYERGVVWETDALHLLSYKPQSPHCTSLLDEFNTEGKGSAGKHDCFVFRLYGGDVKTLARSRDRAFPLPLAKRIALHLLRGLAHMHRRGVVHTDLKLDNILFSTTMTTAQIETWLENDPSRRHPPEDSSDGVVQAAVSQPLPMISEEEALQVTYVLADYGTAQPSKLHPNRSITTPPLRAPEVYLEAEWDKPADIWTFGCLVYELVTSEQFFRYQTNKKFELSETENMIYQMLMHTKEDFLPEQLTISPLAAEFFTTDCRMRKRVELFDWPIEARLKQLNVISKEEAVAIAELMARCLRLNPDDRASVQDLLGDPWFNGVD